MEDYQEKSYDCNLHADVLTVVEKAKRLGFSKLYFLQVKWIIF